MMKNEEFEIFYAKYCEFSIRIAERIVKDTATAEDVSQDVFCYLYKIKERLDSENQRKLHALVVRATVNKARDYLRKAYVRQEVALMGGITDKECQSKRENAEAALLCMEEQQYLKLVFEKLREKNRKNYDVFIKVKILDIPPEHVAREYGITRNNVNNRILRTKLWLKEEYRRLYGDD